jgi:ABC-type phosphate/phosphonate transport system ATPase subunit
MLLIEGLHKRFKNGFVGLESINLTVNRSEIVSLIGTIFALTNLIQKLG